VSAERLCLRNVEVEGQAGLNVSIEGGKIVEIAAGAPGLGSDLDGRGGALIPGLADHHLHLLAMAARSHSADLRAAVTYDDIGRHLVAASSGRPAGAWLRATGCAPALAEGLTAASLDAIVRDRPLRVQDQSGTLWVLNSAGLSQLELRHPPPGLERDAAERPTGRLWRADAWLQAQLGGTLPDLRPLGAELAAMGVVAITDTSATTTQPTADRLADAHRRGDLPQKLRLMSAGPLAAPEDAAFDVGPVKVLLDERDLPTLDDMIARICTARAWRRNVAVHCVTLVELAFSLAAFEAAGARPGDRIEHGGVVPESTFTALEALGLTVVTQPGFISAHGDRYLAEVDPEDIPDLYPCGRLMAAGVKVAFGSDAPYGPLDPWAILRAAVTRTTRKGKALGPAERLAPAAALQRLLGPLDHPGGPPRQVAVGQAADLCLLKTPLAEALDALDAGLVAASVVGGAFTYLSR
jgi:predicted amidohydrolase YtcJ